MQINCSITTVDTKREIKNIEDLANEYPDRFQGIGSFLGKQKIHIINNATPVIQTPRKYPVHIREELKRELEKMEDRGVIKKVNEPTDWVNAIACSRKKNDALRICLDPKPLNKCIKRTHNKTPTLEEISHKLAGAKHFTKLDAKHGYWAIHLDEESSLLTCFNTPFGRYRYLRCPFGLKMSQDIYQQKMDQILEDCEGAIGISDDVCIYGKTIEEHNRRLKKTMDTARKYGLVFNKEKCKIRRKQIKFYGLIWDENGSHPDPEKCDKIKSKLIPANREELQQFLGMIQYLSPFIPKLSSKTAPLRSLLKKDTEYQWNETVNIAFQNFQKKTISMKIYV